MLNNLDLNQLSYNALRLSIIDSPKIFISGPVSKYNNDTVALQIFEKAEKNLRAHIKDGKTFNNGDIKFDVDNIEIINPVKLNMQLKSYDTMDWGDFMSFGLFILNQCDYIYMLDDWQSSEGAKMEKLFADKSGKIDELSMD